MSDQVVGRGIIEVVTDGRKLRAGIEEAKKSIRTLGEGQKDISTSAQRSIDQYIGRLQLQAATVGKTTRETELYKLALRGASNEQLKTADTALLLREANEKNLATVASLKSGFAILGTVAVAGSIAAAAAFDSLLHKAGNFQDLAEKIGDTASNVAALSVAASVGNLSMDSLVTLTNKLSKNLTGVDDESSAAGQAVAVLGINLEQLKAQSPTERIATIADAFDKFSDKGDRAAVAIALFGKAGAEALPFLRELSSGVGRQSILTDEQIRLADEYSDKQKKLAAQISLHAEAIAIELLPAINDFKQALVDILKDQEHAASASDILKAALGGVITVFQTIAVLGSDVAFVFLAVGREIGAIAAQFAALQKLDFKTFSGISDAVKEDAERARKELDKFQARILAIGTAPAKAAVESVETAKKEDSEKPKLEFLGAEAANEQIRLIKQVAEVAQNELEKGISADLAATQARLASTANLLASQRDLERAELDSIARRAAASQAAFEADKAISRARGDVGAKGNIELLASGNKLYDSLIARNNDYLNVFKTNQAQILALDKQLADSRKSTAELLRQIDEAGLTDDQKAAALRTRLLERESSIRLAIAKGDAEEQKKLFDEQQRDAKAFADLGFRHGRDFLEENQSLREQGLRAQIDAAKTIAEEAAKGVRSTAEQINNLKSELANISETALSSIKIRADQDSLSSLVSSIRSAIERETFTVNLQPTIGAAAGGFVQRASGGMIAGPGGPTGDKIPAMLSDGEFVVRSAAVRNYGADLFRMLNAMALPRFADGGAVGSSPAASTDVVTHDIRVGGRPVARLVGPREALRSLVQALDADASAIA